MKKKGSHVGFVLSFLIFVVSLIYISMIISPAEKNSGNKAQILKQITDDIEENISVEVTSISIYRVDRTISKQCIKFDGLQKFTGSSPLVVKDSLNNFLNYSVSGTSVYVKIANNTDRFSRIYTSPDFNNSQSSLSDCEEILESEYSVGAIQTEKKIFDGGIRKFAESYESNYTILKNFFEIPEEDDFSFKFVYSNGTVLGGEEQVLGKNVYIEERRIQYLNNRGEINSCIMRIRLW